IFDVRDRLLLVHAFSSAPSCPILRHPFTDRLARSRGHPAALPAGSAGTSGASRTTSLTSPPTRPSRGATPGKSATDSGDFGFELLNSGCRTVLCELAKLISRKRIRQIGLLMNVDDRSSEPNVTQACFIFYSHSAPRSYRLLATALRHRSLIYHSRVGPTPTRLIVTPPRLRAARS